ncbi:MAG: tetratricopeptide repeat protein, partial [Janthinobacterium lividum]
MAACLSVRFWLLLWLPLVLPLLSHAQQPTPPARDTTLRLPGGQVPPAMPTVALDSLQVLPSAVDYSGWLLLDKDIQLELDGAVQNLYNCKYDKAEKQFRSLRRRYPKHPMPYFLLGLSTWWKIYPTNFHATEYDRLFYAYMDTANTYSERLIKADPHNYEAYFFLAAANGFSGRLNSERHNWARATFNGRRALTYLQKSREA